MMKQSEFWHLVCCFDVDVGVDMFVGLFQNLMFVST